MQGSIFKDDSYETILADYAQKSSTSRGRKYDELPHPFKTPYQRDRDRILHCRAFRRLEYKTQVLTNDYGDHYRTRLTHSLEVSQISRTIARKLHLNEDLCEAISLAHDLGHPPFGHAGEDILKKLMKESSGFNHNIQSLRILVELENKYPQFPGLNLTYEVRRGLLKHQMPTDKYSDLLKSYDLIKNSCIEAQIVDIADEIAYSCNDLEDGVLYGFLTIDDVCKIPLIQSLPLSIGPNNEIDQMEVFIYHLVRSLIHTSVQDLSEQTKKNIVDNKIKTISDVEQLSNKIANFSTKFRKKFNELRRFLYQNYYQHPKIISMTTKATACLEFLFLEFVNNPLTLPLSTQEKLKEKNIKRVVCDYIAGMTDRFAQKQALEKGFTSK